MTKFDRHAKRELVEEVIYPEQELWHLTETARLAASGPAPGARPAEAVPAAVRSRFDALWQKAERARLGGVAAERRAGTAEHRRLVESFRAEAAAVQRRYGLPPRQSPARVRSAPVRRL